MDGELTQTSRELTNNLADILERVLDKGIVIAGDIKIQLADVDLITIKIRLLITSVDKAEKIGIDWWKTDSFFSSAGRKWKLEEKNSKKLSTRKNTKKK